MERSNPLEELLDRLNRQLRSARRSSERVSGTDTGRFDIGLGTSGTGLDLTDAGEEFVVVADVPGFEADDIEIELAETTLSITGERRDEIDDSEETYLRRERRERSFNRQITLPDAVDADAVEATLNNGVLTIRLPKRVPDERGRSIDIDG